MATGATAAAIEARELTKVYAPTRRGQAARVAVDRLTLTVGQGDVFGFLGANGAGKTTTVKMLLGFHAITSGEARLFGKPASDPSARRTVGYLPEQPYFPRFLSASETVKMHGRLAGLSRGDAAKRASLCLDRVGMSTYEKTPLGKMSKGQMQRVAFAAALVGDPSLLILDEPASGLDPIARRDMVQLLRDLAAEGKTIFLSSHFLSEVENLCRRVAILKSGVLVAEGAPADIVRGGDRMAVSLLSAQPEEAVRAIRTALDFPVEVAFPEAGKARLLVSTVHVYAVVAALESTPGAMLEAVTPVRETLEAAFFRLVGGENHDETAHGSQARPESPAPADSSSPLVPEAA